MEIKNAMRMLLIKANTNSKSPSARNICRLTDVLEAVCYIFIFKEPERYGGVMTAVLETFSGATGIQFSKLEKG